MESRIKLLGHPIHPILVDFPVALFATAVIFDLVALISGSSEFASVSFWAISLGLLVGLVAALFGLLDWMNVRGGTRAKRLGAWHGLGNLVVVILFASSWYLRLSETGYAPPGVAVVIALVALGILLITGWLGAEMVFRMRIGVDDDANADAPSSLSAPATEPTTETATDARDTSDTSRPARIS